MGILITLVCIDNVTVMDQFNIIIFTVIHWTFNAVIITSVPNLHIPTLL